MSSAVIGLIILGICIVLFVTNWIPSTATAVLGCLLMVLAGVSKFSSAFSGFSNSVVVLVFCMLTVGMAMQHSGLAYTIGSFILRFAKRERVFVVVSIVVSALLSMFLANMAVIAMFLAIMNSVVESSDDMRMKNICLPICMGSMFGGMCTLVGSTPQMMVQSIMEEYTGFTYKMFDYMPVGLILTGIFILYYLFVGYPLSRKLFEQSGEDETDKAKLEALAKKAYLKKGNKKDKIIVLCVLIIMIVLFVTEIVTNTVTSLIAMFLLIFFRQLDEKAVFRDMDWGVLIRLAGCLGLAAALADCKSGELIAETFISIAGSIMTPRLLLAMVVVLTMVISNFISNSTAIFIVLPSILSIATQLGYSPLALGIASCYAANLCFATPLANAQTGVTMIAGYKFGDYIKYNGLLEVIIAISVVMIVPLFFPL